MFSSICFEICSENLLIYRGSRDWMFNCSLCPWAQAPLFGHNSVKYQNNWMETSLFHKHDWFTWPSYGRIKGLCPYMGIYFLAITMPFLTNFDETLENHYLSISHQKSWLPRLFADFDFTGLYCDPRRTPKMSILALSTARTDGECSSIDFRAKQ